jgi:CheY-like chemotaxis protein
MMKPVMGTGKILLMDDEEDVRQTTGDVLKQLGYMVEFADDGLRAVDLYQEAREAGRNTL